MRHLFTKFSLVTTILISVGGLAGCGPDVDPQPDAQVDPEGKDAGESMDASSPSDSGPEEDAGSDAGGADAGEGCDVDCSAIEAPPCTMVACNDGSLPGAVGECVMVPLPDDTACDDGDFCTVGDTCAGGICTGAPNPCEGATAGECQEVVCDSAAGACVARGSAAMNGMACTYPDLCVTGTTCSNGTCGNGVRKTCDTDDLPTPGQCEAAGCNPATGVCEIHAAREGETCVDPANLCIADSTCTAGECVTGTTPVDCTDLDTQCSVGVCDPSDGSCTSVPANEGASCDDGLTCTDATVCTAGVCAGGTSPACSPVLDGCCPNSCDASNDADCACPGIWQGTTCVYLPSTASAATQTAARADCSALGTGWDLCDATTLCMPSTLTYLAASGCSCSGGDAACSCGSASNVYVHVNGTSPYYIRDAALPGCGTAACTDSVSESCGVPLCCRATP